MHSSRHDTACCVTMKTRLGENNAMWLNLPVKRGHPPGADALWFVHLSPVGMFICIWISDGFSNIDFKSLPIFMIFMTPSSGNADETAEISATRPATVLPQQTVEYAQSLLHRVYLTIVAFFSLKSVYMTASFPGELEFIFFGRTLNSVHSVGDRWR